MIRFRWFAWALGMLLALASLSQVTAQTQQPASDNHGAQAAPEKPAVAFHTGANLVLVDVVVRDKGSAVPDLKASDFQVLEDGKPQPITTFEEHRSTDAVEVSNPPPLPPHVYGDFPRYRTTSAANVLLLDALNTSMQDQKFVRQRMIRYLRGIPPGTQIAVFTLASRLRMVSGFTTNVGTIEQALSQERTPAEKSVMVHPEDDKNDRDLNEEIISASSGTQGGLKDFMEDRAAFRAGAQAEITIAALTQLGRYLSTIPGRKNLIWFSRGFPITFTAEAFRADRQQFQDSSKPLQAMEALLARARVAVYPVDAGGLMNLQNTNIANVTAPTEKGMVADLQTAEAEAGENDITIPQQWGSEQAAMKDLATATGGEAFINTNDVGQAVENAISDGANYYTLGYVPERANDNGAYHAIAVRVPEVKYDLEYRRGYYASDPKQAAQAAAGPTPMTAAMEPGIPPLSQVIFEARVLPAGDPALHGLQPTPGAAGKPSAPLKSPVTRYFVDYSIDPHQLELKDLPDGRRQAELEITQELYDGAGQRVNSTDAGLEVTLTAAQMTVDLKTGVRVRQEIDVPGEDVSMRLGVRDASSGKIGTVEVPIEQGVGTRK
jgi:VWFA-related protein